MRDENGSPVSGEQDRKIWSFHPGAFSDYETGPTKKIPDLHFEDIPWAAPVGFSAPNGDRDSDRTWRIYFRADDNVRIALIPQDEDSDEIHIRITTRNGREGSRSPGYIPGAIRAALVRGWVYHRTKVERIIGQLFAYLATRGT